MASFKESSSASPVTDGILATCEECHAVMSPQELEDHQATCFVEILCPNGCYAQLNKKEVMHHLGNDCPLGFIPCRFGCEEKVMRRENEEHNNENVAKHLSQLLTRIEGQEKKLMEIHSNFPLREHLQQCRLSTGLRILLLVVMTVGFLKGLGINAFFFLLAAMLWMTVAASIWRKRSQLYFDGCIACHCAKILACFSSVVETEGTPGGSC